MSILNDYELATGTIQRLLYEKPLFRYIDKDNINVVVFGFTLLCRRFIDTAFEVAQVYGYKLNITVVSDVADAKEQFLNERPAFANFFNVDDNLVKDPYGCLFFKLKSFDTDVEALVSEILLNKESKYSYLFIDIGDDISNISLASACDTHSKLLYDNPIINCVLTTPQALADNINVVIRNDTIQAHKDYAKLKRMALNCHLLWNNSAFMDVRKLQRQFNREYNFSASLSNALAIQYKLNSVGIDIHSPEVANQFYQLVVAKDSDSNQKIAKLIQMEHQRWNVNMICNGWRPMQDLSLCLKDRKDKKNKQHPCIIPCGVKVGLDDSWKQNEHEKWDSATDSEIAQLDELDQMSVKIHRVYKKKADEIKTKNLIPEYDIYEIRKQLESYPDANYAFSKYVLCLRGITAGVNNQVKLYDYYITELFKALNSVPKNIAKHISKRINTIEDIFYPILESKKFLDYKTTDVDLIKRIPFILTYRTNIHIAIPLKVESGKDVNNQILFGNVASVLQISPSSVTYLVQHSVNNHAQIVRALKYMLNCIKSHNVRVNINICLISEASVPTATIDELLNLSVALKKVDVIQCNSEDDLENKLAEFIKMRKFVAIEKNDSATSGLLYGLRCYRHNPHYIFDATTRKFDCYNGCDFLRYIPFKPHLKISDLFEAKGSRDTKALPDFQQDYVFFWNLYKKSGNKSEAIWKSLCNALAVTDEAENCIKFGFAKNKDNLTTREYYIERRYVDALFRILDALKRYDSTKVQLTFHSNSVYKIKLTASSPIHFGIEKILSKPYLLTDPFDLNISSDWKGVKITFDNLIVEKFYVKNIESKEQNIKEIFSILSKLQDNGYILNLQKKTNSGGDYYSFCYSSHQVKSVLTMSGRILELYVYYKALENGGFDEVANSVEVTWNKENVENEFDIILTSGLRSIIIECKAQATLKQDFYYKLYMLNKEFGINSIPVIIADTCENPDYDNSVNDMQRSRGNETGIITIYKTDDIADIGNKLKALLESNEIKGIM